MTFDERELQTLNDYFVNAPVALHILTADAVVARANRAELAMLGYEESPGDYIGHDLRKFVVEPRQVDELLDRLATEAELQGFPVTLVRRDGGLMPVRIFASGRREGGTFKGGRSITLPLTESRRPQDLEVFQGDALGLSPTSEEEKREVYADLKDFFANAPVSLHVVGADGRIQYTSAKELEAMGYAEHPEEYIGHHIAEFHADQDVIDEMLENLVSGEPLVDHKAKLRTRDGKVLPVFIYSSSRMSGDSFVNTRCFTFPLPADVDVASSVKRQFTWPRNEDYGLNAESAGSNLTKEEAMSLALRYIGGRKRPEETLGFLAECSRILAGAADLDSRLEEALRLTAGYLADEVAVEILQANGDPLSWSVASDALLGQPSGRAAGVLAERAVASRISHACLDARTRLAESPERSVERALLDRGINALIVAPIAVRGEVIGTLSVARAASADRTTFGPADLALTEELARRLSPELEIARLSGSL